MPSRDYCRQLGLLFLMMGLVSLAIVGVTPYFPGPSAEGSGEMVERFAKDSSYRKISPEVAVVIFSVAGGTFFLALLSLLVELMGSRLGFLLMIYPAMVGASFLLLLGLARCSEVSAYMKKVRDSVKNEREVYHNLGDAIPHRGWQAFGLTAAASTACLLLSLSAMFLHWKAIRIVGFTVLIIILPSGNGAIS